MKPSAYLLDTSFLIDYGREVETGNDGPATRTLAKLGNSRLYVSPVTVAELLEGAEEALEAERFLAGYLHMTIGWAAARRCALNQSKATQRMGENDAWQAALAVAGNLTLIGHDKGFERRPWLSFCDHRKS